MKLESIIISVIIPVYNSKMYLRECIESVLAQSLINFELILVDDGSRDNSGIICDQYALMDSRVRVFHQKNAGPSAARNKGLCNAKGTYLAFIDNDDMVHPDYLAILYKLCEKNDCSIAFSKVAPFYNSKCIEAVLNSEETTILERKKVCENLLDMGWNGVSVLTAKIFRRELFQNIEFDESRIIGDDDSIIYKLYWKCDKSVLVNKELYYYRSRREGSITHSKFELSWLTGVDAFHERMEFFKQEREPVLYAKAMRTYCRRLSEEYCNVKLYFPKETTFIKLLQRKARLLSIQMLFLKGNTLKQKYSAILLAWFPRLWYNLENRMKPHTNKN